MKIARDKNGIAILAEEADKINAPFFCVGCKNKLSLHREKNNFFFSHLPSEHCDYADEDPEITIAKVNLYKYLKKEFKDISLEKYYNGFKSDISFKFKEQIVSIDFFTLKTNKDYIQNKTETFTKNNIYILWVSLENLFKKRIKENTVFALDSELFIQEIYIKKIFLLNKFNLFLPVNLFVNNSYLNKKINKNINISTVTFYNPRPFKSFFLKEENPYQGKGMIRKILTSYVDFNGGKKQ